MRLSDVLSKAPILDFKQIEGFLDGRALAIGKQRKIHVGKIALNYYCMRCKDVRTFCSSEELYCIGVNEHLVSIDVVLSCHCDTSVQVWFLVDSEGTVFEESPSIRILKRSEKLSNDVMIDKVDYGDLSELLDKAQRAFRERLGAGAIVYLRKVFEQITTETAKASGIELTFRNGKRKPFKDLLEEVDRRCSIIPREFSENGYKLFGELSDIIHGVYDEELALRKYESLQRLIVGILDSIKNNTELTSAVGRLGWIQKVGDNENE